jgi:streptogramin lyase
MAILTGVVQRGRLVWLVLACAAVGHGCSNVWDNFNGADGGQRAGDSSQPTSDGQQGNDACVGHCGHHGDTPPGAGASYLPQGHAPGAGLPTELLNNRAAWNVTDENSGGVTVTDDGALTLASEFERTHAVWIANDEEGTVSRLDIETGEEVGRYPAIREGRNPQSDPSRTAIDFRGDCWVANRYRGTGQSGSVTKIAAHERDCVDRNHNGQIDTSRDLNGDGIISLGTAEYLDGEDECVLFTVRVGTGESVPRALAIAPDPTGSSIGGNAWVGLNYERDTPHLRRTLELDGRTGAVLREVPLDLNPYGAIASKYLGQVCFVNAGWQKRMNDNPPAIQCVSFSSGVAAPRHVIENPGGCTGAYGITVDAEGHIWVAGNDCRYAFQFDFETESWRSVATDGAAGNSRGLVAGADGNVWVAHSNGCDRGNCGTVTRFNAEDPTDMEIYYLPAGSHSIGIDLDVNGRVWVVNQQSSSASRIDPFTGVIDEFPTGLKPYTYSDFTGHSLYLQFPVGYYRSVLEGCPNAVWHGLNLDGVIPEDTMVEIRVRTAEAEVDLGQAEWRGPWIRSGSLTDTPGPVEPGRFLEFEINLRTMRTDTNTPRVYGLDFLYECALE